MPDVNTEGARVSSLSEVAKNPGFLTRAAQAVRYAISNVTPQTWFGPMQPLQPLAPPEAAGRQFDYAVGANLNYNPRAYEPVSFDQLRQLSTCDIVRMLIETRKDQIDAQKWDIRPRPINGQKQDPLKHNTAINECRAFLERPDKEHDFTTWARMLGEDLFVIDAPTIYVRRTRGGGVYSFDIVDGATIAPRIDANGRRPVPPDVAYQQILKGVPASDYSADQLIYFPRNPRPNHVYGFSPVEQIIMTINKTMRRDVSQLEYFNSGNLSDTVIEAPLGWTQDQIASWQKYWDSLLSGNLSNRRKGMWVPNGAKPQPLKQPDLKDNFDEWLARVASYAFSISPQWAVSQMNRATADTAKKESLEQGLAPILGWYKRLMDMLLIIIGHQELEFVWNEDREIDPAIGAQIDREDAKAGLRTINEARVARGWDPLPDPSCDIPMVLTTQGYVPVGQAGNQSAEPDNTANGEQAAPDKAGEGADPTDDTNSEGEGEDDTVTKLAKSATITRTVSPVTLNRPIPNAARDNVLDNFSKGLDAERKAIVEDIRNSLTKDEDLRIQLNETVERSKLTNIEEAVQKSLEDIAAVWADSGQQTVVIIIGTKEDGMFNAINGRAVSWAKKRGAELVSQLSETTRDRLKAMIATGLENGLTAEQIADLIERDPSGLFNAARADRIAKYEIGNANSKGALAGYAEAAKSGVKLKKRWLLGDKPCTVCQENAAAGPIDLDKDFPSGDSAPLAHLHCECALGAEIEEE